MPVTENSPSLKQAILSIQIICAALIIGALGGAVTLYLVNDNPQWLGEPGVLSIAGVFMAVFCFMAAFIAPRLIRKKAALDLAPVVKADGASPSNATLQKLLEPVQQSIIVGYALIEGPVFANLIFWFVEGSAISLGTACSGLALMILTFPFSNRLLDTIDSMIGEAGQV